MRKIYLILILAGVMTNCTDEDFLERYPISSVTPESFFVKADGFKLYANQFYDDLGDWTGWSIGPYSEDRGSDNLIRFTPDEKLNGEYILPVSDKTWNDMYSNIRKVNIMFSNAKQADLDAIKPYLGEGRFFRAWYYFTLLKRFGSVPWINEPINPSDEEALKTPRSPREVVADLIIADLDYAISALPNKSNAELFRIYKEVALAFKVRVCLYEGTWQKYHSKNGTPFAVTGSDGSKYLEQAVEAAQEVINSSLFAIENTGPDPYYNLFNKDDYRNNKEIMLWRKTVPELRSQNVSQIIIDNTQSLGITKDLVDAYLCTDGLPTNLTTLEIIDDSLASITLNRDPRFAQTIFTPGDPTKIDDVTGDTVVRFQFPNLTKVSTGIQPKKGGSPLASFYLSNRDKSCYIYFRYAEVLLNYIEAKAELHEMGKANLTQNDFDITINKLRDRVGMPHFIFSNPVVDPQDPFTPALPWYIVEIRRERRIELAIEGYRIDDILRWAGANELIKGRIFDGISIKWFEDNGYYSRDKLKHVDENGILSPWYGTTIYANGGYDFDLDRDYLYPVPSQEVQLGGYSQNPGWE